MPTGACGQGTPQIIAVVYHHENQPPTLLMTLSDHTVNTADTLRIEVATGQVVATEMRWRLAPPRDAGDFQAKVSVSYHEEPTLHVFVPAEMSESYQTADELIGCHAEYSGVRHFAVSVTDDVELPH